MKKKILAISLVVSLVAVAALGVTLAYFTDTDTVDNVFTMGNVDISLTEPSFDGGEDNTIDGVAPGDVIPKDPIITNDGDNDAWVFMKLTLSDAEALGVLVPDLATQGLINFNSTNWTFFANNEDTATDTRVIWIGYNTVLASGSTTVAPFTQISIPTYWDNTDMGSLGEEFSLTVDAYAIQADNITSLTAAYTALQGEFL